MNPLYKSPKAMSIFKSVLAVWFTVTTVMPACAGNAPTEVDLKKWGAITAPVYGTSETGVYAGAELFAGPNKFGSYFARRHPQRPHGETGRDHRPGGHEPPGFSFDPRPQVSHHHQ